MSGVAPGRVVIATRASPLALWQSNRVADLLRTARPGLEVELLTVSTLGDRVLDSSLSRIGDKGLFTKELEVAILDGRADIAVHSLKDMQTRLPEGLHLGGITRRHAPEDALVAQPGMTLREIPQGGTVATGSLRRRAQLLALRPDLRVVDVRGNLGTRLARYHDAGWEGMILARAGLERLGHAGEIAEIIPTDVMLPAVAQGALGIECRADDDAMLALLGTISDRGTMITTRAERSFLRRLEGGCQVPIAAHATTDGEVVRLRGLVASTDGRHLVRGELEGGPADSESLGLALAERLLGEGAGAILEEVRRESGA